MHNLLLQCGRPRSGIINSYRLKAQNDYKQAYKLSSFKFERLQADELIDYLLQKNNNSFWKSWTNQINNNKFIDTSISVNYKSDPDDNANEFAAKYYLEKWRRYQGAQQERYMQNGAVIRRPS